MNKLIGLYGTSNTGKSETIRNVFEELCKRFPDFTFYPDFFQEIPESGDICIVIKINGLIIGIESQGDPNSRIFKSLPAFVELNCNIILCATRTRGATVDEVKKYNNEYEIIWICKNKEQDTSKFKVENSIIASDIIDIFIDDLK